MWGWGWGARRPVGIWACIFFPPPVLGIPGNSFQPNLKRAFLGFRTMTGTTQGRGPLHAPEGNGILRPQFRPQLPSRPTGLLPFGTRALVHSPLPHPSSEPLPTHLCPSPHRAQSPPTFTLPGGRPHTRSGLPPRPSRSGGLNDTAD